MDEGLDDFLNEGTEEEVVEAVEPEAEVEPTTEPEEATTEAEPEEPTEGVEEGVPPAPEKPQATIPYAALADERAKRQELERQLAEMQKEPEEKVDFLEDPDRWQQQQEQRLQQMEQKLEQTARTKFIQMTENAARQKHTDYDDVVTDFLETAQANPSLMEAMVNAPDPAEYAYQAALNIRTLKESGGNLQGVVEKAKQEGYQQALKELQKNPPPSPPPTLSKSSSAAVEPAEQEISTDLEDIVINKF